MKYTEADVIIWPDDTRLEDAINKLCWEADSPRRALRDTSNPRKPPSKLVKINPYADYPFVVSHISHGIPAEFEASCIVLKKEVE